MPKLPLNSTPDSTATKTKVYKIADTNYNEEDANKLRTRMIEYRDSATRNGQMGVAVDLSHVIAFMHVAIGEMWKK